MSADRCSGTSATSRSNRTETFVIVSRVCRTNVSFPIRRCAFFMTVFPFRGPWRLRQQRDAAISVQKCEPLGETLPFTDYGLSAIAFFLCPLHNLDAFPVRDVTIRTRPGAAVDQACNGK